MAKVNEFRFEKFNFKDLVTTPELPLADTLLIYNKSGKFYFLDSTGAEKQIMTKNDIFKTISFYVDDVLEVDTNLISVIAPQSLIINEIRLMVDIAPTGTALIIDINKNGTTLYTTQANRPTIAVGETSIIATLPDTLSLTVGDKISIDIDQIGTTLAGENLSIAIICEVV